MWGVCVCVALCSLRVARRFLSVFVTLVLRVACWLRVMSVCLLFVVTRLLLCLFHVVCGLLMLLVVCSLLLVMRRVLSVLCYVLYVFGSLLCIV